MNRLAGVDKTHDLVCWLIPIVSQFPREQGAQLGERLSTSALELLDLLVEAQVSPSTYREALNQAGVRVERTLAMLLLARDLGLLGSDLYERGAAMLTELKHEIDGVPRLTGSVTFSRPALILVAVVLLGIACLATFYRPVSQVAVLDVRSQPGGASVTLDGVGRGNTPLRLENVPAGAHTVELALQGHRAQQVSLHLETGKTFPVDVSLLPSPGEIVLESHPDGVDVLIDGKVVATHINRGARLAVDAGTHSVEVHRPHYQTWRTSVTVASDRTLELPLSLKSSPGALRVDSIPSGARVVLNGRSVGLTPLVVRGLPAERLKVRVEKAGYMAASEAVRVKADQTVPLQVKLPKMPVAESASVVWRPVQNAYRPPPQPIFETHSHSF